MKKIIILLCVLALIGGTIWIFVRPVYTTTETFTELDRNMGRLKQMGNVLRQYASEHEDQFPVSLEMLAPEYLESDQIGEILLYHDSCSKRTYDWIYWPNSKVDSGAEWIVAASPSSQLCAKRMMHHRLVLHPDTVVKFMTEEEYRNQIGKQQLSQVLKK